MDQTLTGTAGIASEEAFGSGLGAHIIQILITGSSGIPSGESFTSGPAGVRIDPFSVPRSIWLAY